MSRQARGPSDNSAQGPSDGDLALGLKRPSPCAAQLAPHLLREALLHVTTPAPKLKKSFRVTLRAPWSRWTRCWPGGMRHQHPREQIRANLTRSPSALHCTRVGPFVKALHSPLARTSFIECPCTALAQRPCLLFSSRRHTNWNRGSDVDQLSFLETVLQAEVAYASGCWRALWTNLWGRPRSRQTAPFPRRTLLFLEVVVSPSAYCLHLLQLGDLALLAKSIQLGSSSTTSPHKQRRPPTWTAQPLSE